MNLKWLKTWSLWLRSKRAIPWIIILCLGILSLGAVGGYELWIHLHTPDTIIDNGGDKPQPKPTPEQYQFELNANKIKTTVEYIAGQFRYNLAWLKYIISSQVVNTPMISEQMSLSFVTGTLYQDNYCDSVELVFFEGERVLKDWIIKMQAS